MSGKDIKEFEKRLEGIKQTELTYPIGTRAVVFTYTNTKPECSGIIVAETKNFIELVIGTSLFGRPIKMWFPKSDVQVVINE